MIHGVYDTRGESNDEKQVSKRGRRLTKTMKKIERHDSSEEEELVFKAKEEDQESDPEDFPPGAPEVSNRLSFVSSIFVFGFCFRRRRHVRLFSIFFRPRVRFLTARNSLVRRESSD